MVLIFTFLAAFHAVMANSDDLNVVGAVIVVVLFVAAAVTMSLEKRSPNGHQ